MLMPETSIEKSLVIGGNCKHRGGTTNFVNIAKPMLIIISCNCVPAFLCQQRRHTPQKRFVSRQDEDHWPANPWQAQELGVGAIYWSWKKKNFWRKFIQMNFCDNDDQKIGGMEAALHEPRNHLWCFHVIQIHPLRSLVISGWSETMRNH